MSRPPDKEQQLLRNARRESRLIMLVWAVALAWSVGVGYVLGYDKEREIHLILGMPDWVFWAIVLPWALILIFSAWFCFGFMADDDLGSEPEDRPAKGDAHE